jgi:hypothetical protein
VKLVHQIVQVAQLMVLDYVMHLAILDSSWHLEIYVKLAQQIVQIVPQLEEEIVTQVNVIQDIINQEANVFHAIVLTNAHAQVLIH